jgi:hypothetical protein
MNNSGEMDSPIGSAEYQVNLDVFQGPLDLLLFLIRKKKIDIHDGRKRSISTTSLLPRSLESTLFIWIKKNA